MVVVFSYHSLCEAVILYKRTKCGAYERAAATLHTKHDLAVLESLNLVLLGLDLKSLGEGGGNKTHGAGGNTSATVDAGGCGTL